MKPQTRLRISNELRFGLTATYRLVLRPLVVATSMLPSAELVLQQLLALGAVFSKDWTENCTHLVMASIKLSAKVACALASGGLIVTPEYLTALVRAATDSQPVLPPAQAYLPAITEPSIKPSPNLFAADGRRKTLFAGKTFFCGSKRAHRRLSEIIRLAGGRCSILQRQDIDSVSAGSALLLKTADEDGGPTIAFTAALGAVKKAGLHVIPESDIVLAVLYCSTERFCNPAVSQQILLERSALQSQTSTTIYAPETQDLGGSSSSASSKKSPGGRTVIPETPSSSCSGKTSTNLLIGQNSAAVRVNSGLNSDNCTATISYGVKCTEPIKYDVKSDKANHKVSRTKEISALQPTAAQVKEEVGKCDELPTPSLGLAQSSQKSIVVNGGRFKKRFRSAENGDIESASKRPAIAKPAPLPTPEVDLTLAAEENEIDDIADISSFAPPCASTQIFDDETAAGAPRTNIAVQSSAAAQSNSKILNQVGVPSTVGDGRQKIEMIRSNRVTSATCVPPTPTPPSQANHSLVCGADAGNNLVPETASLSDPTKSSSFAALPSLETLRGSYPETQFCPELQIAPLPSLEPPSLDCIRAPVSAQLRDPFASLDTNSCLRAVGENTVKNTNVFQLPTSIVPRRIVKQAPSGKSTNVSLPMAGGIKRLRSTVEEEQCKDPENDVLEIKPEPRTQTPSPHLQSTSHLTPTLVSREGFLARKRFKHENKTPSAPTDETLEPSIPVAAANLEPSAPPAVKEDVKPCAEKLDNSFKPCQTLMVSLVMRTSILGEEHRPSLPNESNVSKNFKRFRKVRHGSQAGSVVSLPRIIGGKDLLPHTSRIFTTEADDTQGAQNPRSLWFSQHPEVTRILDQEDEEREEDAREARMDVAHSGARSFFSSASSVATKSSSFRDYFNVAGSSGSDNVARSIDRSRSNVGSASDFSQFQMPATTVKRRFPRTRI
ncbi:nibrin [Hyalella azteca]|uniref:Nibrin n=1 Tax=Hyalella azteca TaxID=294128 RepID=A0A8B7PIF8_HYAAZ|nr:nibrin [Hyalella azteca]